MDGGGDEKLQVRSAKKKPWPELFMLSSPCTLHTSWDTAGTTFIFPVDSLAEGGKTVSYSKLNESFHLDWRAVLKLALLRPVLYKRIIFILAEI